MNDSYRTQVLREIHDRASVLSLGGAKQGQLRTMVRDESREAGIDVSEHEVTFIVESATVGSATAALRHGRRRARSLQGVWREVLAHKIPRWASMPNAVAEYEWGEDELDYVATINLVGVQPVHLQRLIDEIPIFDSDAKGARRRRFSVWLCLEPNELDNPILLKVYLGKSKIGQLDAIDTENVARIMADLEVDRLSFKAFAIGESVGSLRITIGLPLRSD